MRSLHRKCYAHAESRQRYHGRGAHTYENHLPEDRRDLEELTREWRNENPVEQTEIKLDVVFHLPIKRAECQGARIDESRKFSCSMMGFASSTVEKQWPKAKSMLSARY